jgi:peptidoglycan/LPS O-acetylase OafA/YrhL
VRTASVAAAGSSTPRLLAIDGLRALSILWLMAFHIIYFLGYFIPADEYVALVNHPLTRVLARGDFGVDVFFVISGFLISHLLLDELRARSTLSPARFYLRRLFRIVPACVVALFLATAIGEPDKWRSAWANLLFINNYRPSRLQPMAWSWSLAVEEHFYLVIPWIMLALHRWARRPVLPLLALLAAAFAIHHATLARHGIVAPVPLHPRLGPVDFYAYFDLVYQTTHTRFGGILCGVIAAYLGRDGSRVRRWLLQSRLRPSLLLAACLAGLLLLVTERGLLYRYPGAPSAPIVPTIVYLTCYRYVFALLVAGVTLSTALAPTPIASALSSPIWRPVAELSYSAYLLHPLIIGIGYYGIFRPDHITPGRLLLYGAYGFAASFGLAWVLYRWVEAPCRLQGRRLTQR